jgi:hypothetical protein
MLIKRSRNNPVRVSDVQDLLERLSPLMELVDRDGELVTGMEVIDGKLVVYIGDECEE